MKNYLLWSLRQFYLIYFCPTQFQREFEGTEGDKPKLTLKQRFLYFLKILPWIILLPVIGNLIVGLFFELMRFGYNWNESWRGVAFGVVFGIAFSVAFGVTGVGALGIVVGVVGGIAFGVGCSIAFGVMFGVVAFGVVFCIVVGVVFGVALGVTFSTALSVMYIVMYRIALRVVFGVVFSVVFGVSLGGAFTLGYGVAKGIGYGVAIGIGLGVAFNATYFRLYFYPFDVLVSFLSYIRARQFPQQIAREWSWHPISWNEVIWLPLPYAGKLLTLLAMQDREEGLRQIAFVASERRLQRRVAMQALEAVIIKDLQANTVKEIASVSDRLSWVTDTLSGFSDTLKSVLPRFDLAAQQTAQYLSQHSNTRKTNALRDTYKTLKEVFNILTFSNEKLTIKLLPVVAKWIEIIEIEGKEFSAKKEASNEIPNPFAFGNAVSETTDNTFVGRSDIVRKVEDNILGSKFPPTLLLQGARRMGKTSILNQLPRMLGPNFAPVGIDCQDGAFGESQITILRYLSRKISDGLRRRYVEVKPIDRDALRDEPFSVFGEWLEKLERKLPDEMRVLLCFDEYERLSKTIEAGWGINFLDTLRHWMQHHPQLVLMFTGSRPFEALGAVWTDRFISVRRLRMSFLSREEVLPLLTEPVPEFDMTYADGALDVIITNTNGQPFLTQAVAYELVQYLNDEKRKEATVADVEIAIDRAFESGSAYFYNYWSDAEEEGQAILTSIARNEPMTDSPKTYTWLRENDVLNDKNEFAVPMMRRWVEKYQL